MGAGQAREENRRREDVRAAIGPPSAASPPLPRKEVPRARSGRCTADAIATPRQRHGRHARHRAREENRRREDAPAAIGPPPVEIPSAAEAERAADAVATPGRARPVRRCPGRRARARARARGTGHGARGTGHGARGTGHGARGTGHGRKIGGGRTPPPQLALRPRNSLRPGAGRPERKGREGRMPPTAAATATPGPAQEENRRREDAPATIGPPPTKSPPPPERDVPSGRAGRVRVPRGGRDRDAGSGAGG